VLEVPDPGGVGVSQGHLLVSDAGASGGVGAADAGGEAV